MAKILVIRLSAIGDVAMTIPVIYSAARANPGDTFTVLTQAFLIPLFINRPPNVEITGINTFGAEKSLGGLLRFARAYATYDFDVVIDLHRVLRTRIICLLFRLKGKKIFSLDKARKERRRLTRQHRKRLQPLRPVVQRYADVFQRARLSCPDAFRSLFSEQQPARLDAIEDFTGRKEGRWIGIAPFARHQGKIYPLGNMEKVVAALSQRHGVSIFLFGGRDSEKETLRAWAERYPNVRNVAGRFGLDNELALLSRLDVLLCMDSANMHFASLTNTPVVSIWGATHPYAGFYGYRQNPANAVQLDLPCRPCSIYGQKPCHRGDWACLTQIPPENILSKI